MVRRPTEVRKRPARRIGVRKRPAACHSFRYGRKPLTGFAAREENSTPIESGAPNPCLIDVCRECSRSPLRGMSEVPHPLSGRFQSLPQRIVPDAGCPRNLRGMDPVLRMSHAACSQPMGMERVEIVPGPGGRSSVWIRLARADADHPPQFRIFPVGANAAIGFRTRKVHD
jgi:hypothetical protein